MDKLTEQEKAILMAWSGSDSWRALRHAVENHECMAQNLVEQSKIGCEVYQDDLRFNLGMLKGIRIVKRILGY